MPERYEFGDPDAHDVLVWIAGAHEKEMLSSMVSLISSNVPYALIAYVVPDCSPCWLRIRLRSSRELRQCRLPYRSCVL